MPETYTPSQMAAAILAIPGGGDDMHTYSTKEQAVGTWIDGKPLYERSYLLTTVSGTMGTLPSGIEVINVFGGLKFAAGQAWQPLTTFYDSSNYFTVYINSSGEIKYSGAASYLNKTCYLVVQYTKNSDSAS